MVEVRLQRPVIAVGDVDRVGEDRAAPLQVEKPRRPLKLEGHLLRIEQVEGRHVVPAEPQMAEAGGERGRVAEQVGDDRDHRPLPDRLGKFVEHLGQPRRAGGPCLLEDIEHEPEVRGAAAGRERPHDAVGHAGDAHGVALLRRQVAEGGGDPSGILDLGDLAGAEVHRPGGVEHEAQPEVGVGLVLLHVVAVGPPERPPVEPSQIVTRHVLAVFGELHARPAVWAGMAARHTPDHRPSRHQRHRRQPRQRIGDPAGFRR